MRLMRRPKNVPLSAKYGVVDKANGSIAFASAEQEQSEDAAKKLTRKGVTCEVVKFVNPNLH